MTTRLTADVLGPLNLGPLVRHGADIQAICFTHDAHQRGWAGTSQQLAVCGRFHDAMLFSTASGERAFSLNVGAWVYAAAFSPDDTILALGGHSMQVMLFSVADRELVRVLQHSAPVRAISFSPEGSLVASGGRDNCATIFEVSTGERKRVLESESEVRALSFSPNGERFAVGGENKRLHVHVLKSTDGAFKTFGEATGVGTEAQIVQCLSLSSDGTLLAVGTNRKCTGSDTLGFVQVFETVNGVELTSAPIGTEPYALPTIPCDAEVRSVRFVPLRILPLMESNSKDEGQQRQLLVVADLANTIRVFDVGRSGQKSFAPPPGSAPELVPQPPSADEVHAPGARPLHTLHADHPVYDLSTAMMRDGTALVAACGGTHAAKRSAQPKGEFVVLNFSRVLAALGSPALGERSGRINDRTVGLVHQSAEETEPDASFHNRAIRVRLSPDGSLIALASSDSKGVHGHVQLRAVRRSNASPGYVKSRIVIKGHTLGRAELSVDFLHTFRFERQLPKALAFNSDGTMLAIGGRAPCVRFMGTAAPYEELFSIEVNNWVRDLAISRTVLSQTPPSAEVAAAPASRYPIAPIEFVAVASRGGKIDLHACSTRELVTSWPQNDWVNALCFSPDGDTLVAGGREGNTTMMRVLPSHASAKTVAFWAPSAKRMAASTGPRRPLATPPPPPSAFLPRDLYFGQPSPSGRTLITHAAALMHMPALRSILTHGPQEEVLLNGSHNACILLCACIRCTH